VQRPLPDNVLEIVTRGEAKEDQAAAASINSRPGRRKQRMPASGVKQTTPRLVGLSVLLMKRT
jgi:hypothetical protein